MTTDVPRGPGGHGLSDQLLHVEDGDVRVMEHVACLLAHGERLQRPGQRGIFDGILLFCVHTN